MIDKIFFRIFTVLFVFYAQISAQEYKVGDKSDGSKFNHVHLLKLYDYNGNTIDPNDPFAPPFSTKQTCATECHSYKKISKGFHFNFHDSNLTSSTQSEPWIYTDPTTLSIIPISFRKNKGSFSPEDVKLSPMDFLFRFGPYYAGGDISEEDSLQSSENYLRWMVSGKLEINCLLCHNANFNYDRAEYASNIRKKNFKWATVGSSEFAEFKGNASRMPDNYDPYNFTTVQSIDQRLPIVPKLKYTKSKFNSENKVYFNVTKDIPNRNCYYCHSSVVTDNNFKTISNNVDVHIKAGMKCVDCHSNDIDHNMLKGTEHSSTYTCESCHTQTITDGRPTNGNLGAPIPKHAGIPPTHFEKLSCTTCHSGTWPSSKNNFIKTSRNHFLGMHGTNKAGDVFPHIITNVFTESDDNKIEPKNIIWPSYWGVKDSNKIKPLTVKFVEQTIRPILALDSLTNFGNWPSVSDSVIIAILDSLKSFDAIKGKPVFVTGGKIFSLENKKLISYNNPLDLSYSWKTAHNVRPAAQALGVNGCTDCHSLNSPFFTTDINVESSLFSQVGIKLSANKFQDNSKFYQTFFSFTFYFRPWLKFIIILSAFIITVIFVGYAFKGLKSISNIVNANNSNAKKD
jgi:hypothetical protein